MFDTDGDAILLYCSRITFFNPTNDSHRRIIQSLEFMLTGKLIINRSFSRLHLLFSFIENDLFFYFQHLYVYGVLVFEAMATFIGQVSVLSLIAIFGAATTAMVICSHKPFAASIMSSLTIV